MKVLIVEDDIVIAESHKEMLQDFGLTSISSCHVKQEALQMINENKYDLVLLDAKLETGMEGVELGSVLNNDFKVPFIYLTANTDLESVKSMVATKPISYLSKPIRKSELFAAISLVPQVQSKVEEKVYSLKDGASLFRFTKENFLYAQSSGNYIKITLLDKNKGYLIRMSLETFLQEVQDEDIVRVSRFYVVNTSKIEELRKRSLVIAQEKIAYSRTKYEELLVKLDRN